MCSYALACYYHPCQNCEHKSPAPVAKKVFPKEPIPLKEVEVNLSFISRLPKLLDINWKCIYVWKKVEKTKAANTAKLRNHQENKEMPNVEYQGMRNSALIEADESLVPESSEEEEEASGDSSESEFMSATIGDRAQMFKEQKICQCVEPPLFERQKKTGVSQRRKSDEESHCVSTMKNGVRNKQVPKESDTTRYECEESILQDVVMDETDAMSVNAAWQAWMRSLRPTKIRAVKRVTPKREKMPSE